MVDGGVFQDFINEFPKVLWHAFEGKKEVSIDIVSGTNCRDVAVIVIKTGDNPYIREITEVFSMYMSDYGMDMRKLSLKIVGDVKKRDEFFIDSKMR